MWGKLEIEHLFMIFWVMTLVMADNDIAFGSIFSERNYLDVDIPSKKKNTLAFLCSIQLPPRLHMFTKRTFKLMQNIVNLVICLQTD